MFNKHNTDITYCFPQCSGPIPEWGSPCPWALHLRSHRG